MSVFKKFDKTDIIHSVITTSPQFNFVSGSQGWRGNQGVSSSISLYEGLRARSDINRASIRPIYRRSQVVLTGAPADEHGSYPLTASLRTVTVRPGQIPVTDQTNWGEQYWDAIQQLYSWHSAFNSEYHTGSYDFYSLFFARNSTNIVSRSGALGVSNWDTISSSFTMEFLVKPFAVTSALQDFTLASRNGIFYAGITGSTGKLVFSGSFMGLFTSSISIDERRWSHVVIKGANNTGSFLVDLVDAGTFTYTGSMSRLATSLPAPALGNVFVSPSVAGTESGSDASAVGSTNRSFYGMMHEAKFWAVERTWAQLSSSANKSLIASSSAGLVAYYRMNQGPLYRSNIDPALYTIGSGVLDYSPNGQNLTLASFSSRRAPVWLPNDNIEFYPQKNLAVQSSSLPLLRVVNIPSIMYGRQIMTGSVEITCRAYDSSSIGLVRVLVDDGRGGLYISGSLCSSSLENKENYNGTFFNKVGNVFYSEGLIIIKDPSLFDYGSPDSDVSTTSHPLDLFSVSFKGMNFIPSTTLMCHIDAGEFNASNNPTFVRYDEQTGKLKLVNEDQTTYVTSIGIFDSNRRLVATAKLASPVRNRLKDRLNIRLRKDF